MRAFACFAVLAATVTLAAQTQESAFERITLTAGRSRVLTTDFDVTRIAVTNPSIADAVVVEPREILIDSKAPGTISLIIWGATARVQYDVVVEPAVSALQQQLRALFPGEDINVGATDEAIVLSGRTSSSDVALRAAEIVQASSSKVKVVNLLQRPGGPDTQQVMLQVRFAEVDRSAVEELGVTLYGAGANGIGRVTTQQFPAPNYDVTKGGFTFSDYLNLFFFGKQNLGAVIKALQQRGQLQILAEPNLIAYNGQEASFLAGGEFPIPVVQSGTTGLPSIAIQFKEFGVRLTFRPTIAGDVIRLKVKPEVSALDPSRGLRQAGFDIPALITRRAETDVELRDGQSFAIAGLLNNSTDVSRAHIPLLADLPIVGALFKSKRETRERQELMVLITPRLVRPLDPSQVPPLPMDPKSFLPSGNGLGGGLGGGRELADAPALATATKGSKQ